MLCLLWFCFTLLSDWLKKLTLTQPVRRKTETNRDLVARILLHLTLITVVCALISDNLAHFVFNLFPLLLVRVITLVLVLLHSFENCSINSNNYNLQVPTTETKLTKGHTNVFLLKY